MDSPDFSSQLSHNLSPNSFNNIQNGDILLFRGHLTKYFIPTFSYFVYKFSGPWTHAAIAYRNNGHLDCIEFKEFGGGRIVRLQNIFKQYKSIDVYRVRTPFIIFRPQPEKLEYDADQVINYLHSLTGLRYNWKTIWLIVRDRLGFPSKAPEGPQKAQIKTESHTCSSAIAEAFKRFYVNPCPDLYTVYVTPTRLAQSPLFQYMFTIGVQNERK